MSEPLTKKPKVMEDLVPVPAEYAPTSLVPSREKFNEMYNRSIADPEGFWSEIADTFHWQTKYDEVGPRYNFTKSKGKVEVEWFMGGKTNLCYNCLDRHVLAGDGDKPCFVWEGNEPTELESFSYAQVLDQVCRFANVLKSLGVGKGDNVAIYLPMIVQLPFVMLACARIGAVHSVVFGGFSSEALADRMVAGRPKVIVTADGVMRGAKLVTLKQIADGAHVVAKEQGVDCPIQVVVKRLGCDAPFEESRDRWWHELVDSASAECECEWVDAEDPLFMLYTSGSTGKPKGVLHSTGGYMIGAATTTKYVFDIKGDEVYWCTADCGWITGHSYIVYGPLCNGTTSLIFEGVPTYPSPNRFWDIVERHKVNIFYTAPTAIRSLMKFGDEHVTKHDLSTLRVLGTVGEPINPEAWRWYYTVIGGDRCPIVDTWWQTETGAHCLTSLPGAVDMKPGSATLPFFGVEPAVLDPETGKELEGECSGYLVIKKPWPSCMRTVYEDHARFEETYFGMFDGYYFTGDGCKRDKDGYYWLTGRVDDVMNCSGHRLGTSEIESALVHYESVAEAAVVGFPHDIKGEGIYCYVTLKDGVEYTDDLRKVLKQEVRSEIGAFATPDVIHWAPVLPKTRSGKIMRRILRKVAHNELDSIGDTSTLADPDVIDKLLNFK
eukprot:TRINITY_DN16279_c0_g1_i2.p1 TRINITY_DN16279_c0_g1~~TRINITY_DN16279_c0_g1_i2.p1  ORF type:complete len:663 (-),score=194.98 TRINITY_DN16279_c0_g1_i2:239-2227(-)